ncbi:HAD family hydrolase [Pseudoramibacter faecis]|uniref:HAD family hydrolase n=1 Tax=Pseudoramibacter faecis TaxID=3108534 RepID=UPI002E79BB16|nr:HAD family hydrolase [Pseudoramibacter sp. HA2172]
MTAKKYFFFDIDGTLTDRTTNQIVPSARVALKKLSDAGHFVAINTGRAHYKARPFFEANGFSNMVCSGGHGLVIDGELVENPPLDYAAAKALYDEAIAAGYGVLVAEDDSIDVYARDFAFIEQMGPRLEATRYIIEEHYVPIHAIYKMYLALPRGEEHRLSLLNQPSLGRLRFDGDYLIIQPDEKRGGLLRMLERVGGAPEDVVVFGDDTNDFDMFTPPFTRVAMGNAHPKLKAMADIVAPANVDDGIYRICEKQGWF